MGHKWKYLKLKEAGVQLIDCIHKTPPAAENGYPYIGIPQMRSGGIDFSANPRLISKKHLDEWSVKAKPIQNDIILSRRCNPGETVYVPEGVEFALGQNLVILRASGELIYPPFLRWLVRGQEWWGEIGKYLNVGAVFDSLRCGDIPNFKLPIPPLSEQKRIAHILGSLDDKIELNRQMNATLEGMAQALFKSWFVDFDPVIDNALAAGNPIPEAFAARAETRRKALADGTANRDVAKQFPAAFQFTEEMGWIPDGWKISKLKDCTNKIGSGSTPRGGSSAYIDEGIKLVRSQNIYDSSFRWSGLVCITDEAADKLKGVILTERDVLINITGDSILRTCVVDPSVLPARVNQHVAILRPKNYLPKHYLHQYIVRSEYKTYLLGFDAGGSRKAVTKGHLEEAEILLPHYNILDAFSDVVDPFFDHKNKNELQIRTLSSLRDTLLPKLISGEIRIPEAEKLTEEALA